MKSGGKPLLVALVVSAIISAVSPASVEAAAGGPMTAVDGHFTGTAGDDLLVIARDADVLTHNRFATNDPGFASAADFDSTVSGVQTKSTGSKIRFTAHGGDDTLQVVGGLPFPVQAFDGGDGLDSLDMSSATTAAALGPASNTTFPTVERFYGTNLGDVVQPDTFSAQGAEIQGRAGDDTLAGGPGNDTVDGGVGANTLDGGAGDDLLAVAVPLTHVRRQIHGGAGNDTLFVRGFDAADALSVGGTPTVVTDKNNDAGGYQSGDVEHVHLSLGVGNDSVSISPSPVTVVVDGASGDDAVVIDADRRTATVTHDAAAAAFVDIPGFGRTSLLVVEDLSIVNEMLVATAPGTGGGPHVRAFRGDGEPVASFFAYAPTFSGGVSVALGDVDGDGNDEIITGARAGGGPHVRVFRWNGADTGIGFFAYEPGFSGGVNVATADVNGDGVDEIVTVPASSGGPHVRVWSGKGDLVDEWNASAFGNSGLFVSRGAVFGTAGGADAGDQILLSHAPGGPSLVRAYESDGTPASGFGPYSPYGATFAGGASVAGGNFASATRPLDALRDEVVTGAGPGGGPHVRIVEREGNGYTDVGGFYAYEPNFRGGVVVATCNVDGGDDEVLTGAGPGGGPHVRLFSKAGAPLPLSFMAYDPNFHGGVRVACGAAESKSY